MGTVGETPGVRMHMNRRPIATPLIAAVLALAACAPQQGDDAPGEPTDAAPASVAPAPATDPAESTEPEESEAPEASDDAGDSPEPAETPYDY